MNFMTCVCEVSAWYNRCLMSLTIRSGGTASSMAFALSPADAMCAAAVAASSTSGTADESGSEIVCALSVLN